jgi:HK97 family phage major capsid protein
MPEQGDIQTAAQIRVSEDIYSDVGRYVAYKRALSQRVAAMRELYDTAEERGGKWLASETKAYSKHGAESDLVSVELEALRLTMPSGEGAIQASSVAYDAHWPAQHTGRGSVYGPAHENRSWTRDMISVAQRGDPEARERLAANTTEYRAMASNIAGAVGEFVPPVWLMNDLVRIARPGRVFADKLNPQPLPENGNTVEIPTITQGTTVGFQTTENTNVASQDMATSSLSATMKTIAGQAVVSRQLLDRSPLQVDQIVLQDMSAVLAVAIDNFAISNNVTGAVGVLQTSGINSITYTDASPTVGELYPKIANAIQQINTKRYLPPTAIFCTPARWAWFESALDPNSRPLVLPAANVPQNLLATMGPQAAEGLVGSVMGLPLFVDPNLPQNQGTGTNQDVIVVARLDDIYLWESQPHVYVDQMSLAQQLSVRFVMAEYLAIQAARYPASVSVISGTGLVAPSF